MPWVDQSKSDVEGDQVGRDKYDIHTMNVFPKGHQLTVVDKLLICLQQEMSSNEKCPDLIAKLQRYHGGLVVDGVIGLEAKLNHSNRAADIPYAKDTKEQFVMLLERWSYYASAQEIFVYLMARAEHKFNTEIRPLLPTASEVLINQKFNDLIVEPTVSDCGATVFSIDNNTAMGMVYWLAEQCFVRWH